MASILPYTYTPLSSVYHDEKDVYGIDVALLSNFENQVIQVNVHNLSKSTTIRILALGTKFIPKWNHQSEENFCRIQ